AGLDHDEPKLIAADVPVPVYDSIRERGQFAEQLHADQSAADDDESELPALPSIVDLHVGPLEALDDLVTKDKGVGKSLERENKFRARDHFSVCHPAKRDDELIIG